ncbi:serine-type D-Ala-D-Ala carboxypeptidase [Roseivivax halodurans JCM 10272]|uniref:Serine-type D-Ala-D-Ala carboxypeptidase n=1 Tax=Roseivivax halodurans JCM 10272 TaxID=1449350 RepID=X7EJD6_9RHOB|nr:D-alanyl-D-alanine carboxypeptidase family protein [Roseivivax halodurans]ETX16022.1 serine-type D-Ala-D-Ala carboxypeptidase [Roseivivax halodurans JCM 10272]
MTGRRRGPGQTGLFILSIFVLSILAPIGALAAPYAGMVMDARSGNVYYSENADTRLHPASLTKMMTLYIAFEAVEHGELSMDTMITVSRNAASEPPSKLGLRTGQKIALRYCVRAAAVKSANDCATAIGEAISGSEAAFARRMNRTAKALGMTRTTFKNAHGLTESGHLSTARDMSILGRHVLYDYPEYYNLFSRITADAGVGTVYHTNRRLLRSYTGADGIKTGYTRAAGFNLVASAERGGERVIATVFGGKSTASRNAQVAKLLDLGFTKAPSRIAFAAPRRPSYQGNSGINIDVARNADPVPGAQGRSVRMASAAVTRSLRPAPRPGSTEVLPPALVAEVAEDIETVIASADAEAAIEAEADKVASAVEAAVAVAASEAAESDLASDAVEAAVAIAANDAAVAESMRPRGRPAAVVLASAGGPTETEVAMAARSQPETETVSRVSTSGGRHWGINIGRYPSRYAAQKVLLKTALSEMSSLDGSLRKVVERPSGYDANFMGMTREMADLACRRLQAQQTTCFMVGPPG